MSNVPDIRFKGFTDAWEQRELGEVVQFINGKAFKQHELLDKGKYRVLRVGNFNTNNQWYYSNLELSKDKYIEKGDLVYLWATTFGPEFWNEEKVIYHYHIWKVNIIYENLDKHYLYSWMNYDKNKILNNTNGSTMIHITKENMDSRKICFPNIGEQEKIGLIFAEVNQTITLLQRKLDSYEKLKKGLLQKLFPNGQNITPELRFSGFNQ
ncbi:restriction endonuclease subunit S, partial [Macrococcus capreoli]|uniref:restriction endonuclease subunit S n=1 Tax=Macrococcus capreoli TaxID=2982690 RepID=UPI0021D5A277